MLDVESISPIDGRYRAKLAELAGYFSEGALHKYRIIIEGEYFIALSKHPKISLRKFNKMEAELIRSLYEPTLKEIEQIKKIEKTTNHDVKAVEYYLKEKLQKSTLSKELEWIHFALTSEDVNNLAYGLILSEAVKNVIIPTLEKLFDLIDDLAQKNKNSLMLARTHGQSASPTTMGKELKIFADRLQHQIIQLNSYKLLVKLNGATGNYNAHRVAFPEVNWPKFTRDFVADLAKMREVKLTPNLITAQIEPHDTYAEIFDIMRRVNVILIDFDQDIWRYISDGWIKQRPIKGEIGSSTMPHKVNPIDFENSEGNLGIANALFGFFSLKLPISRLQRDLSDSTVERNFGVAFAHSLLSYKSTIKGLGKIEVNREKLLTDLKNHPEVLAEALQVIFRREGLASPYEKMKDLTRGKQVTKEQIDEFIDNLEISKELRKSLKKITPENYIGLADKLV